MKSLVCETTTGQFELKQLTPLPVVDEIALNRTHGVMLEICLLAGSKVPSTLNLVNYCKQTA